MLIDKHIVNMLADEPRNSHRPKRPLDNQSVIKEHLIHELLHIGEHVGVTEGFSNQLIKAPKALQGGI